MIKHILNIKLAESHMGFFYESKFSLLYVPCVTVTTEAAYSRIQRATLLIGPHRPDGALCCKSNFHFELQYPLREHQCFKNNHIMV